MGALVTVLVIVVVVGLGIALGVTRNRQVTSAAPSGSGANTLKTTSYVFSNFVDTPVFEGTNVPVAVNGSTQTLNIQMEWQNQTLTDTTTPMQIEFPGTISDPVSIELDRRGFGGSGGRFTQEHFILVIYSPTKFAIQGQLASNNEWDYIRGSDVATTGGIVFFVSYTAS